MCVCVCPHAIMKWWMSSECRKETYRSELNCFLWYLHFFRMSYSIEVYYYFVFLNPTIHNIILNPSLHPTSLLCHNLKNSIFFVCMYLCVYLFLYLWVLILMCVYAFVYAKVWLLSYSYFCDYNLITTYNPPQLQSLSTTQRLPLFFFSYYHWGC